MSNYAEHDLIEIEDDWINFLHSSPVTTIGALMKICAVVPEVEVPVGKAAKGDIVDVIKGIQVKKVSLAMLVKAPMWDESLHPRDEIGQFTSNGGASAGSASLVPVAGATEEQLERLKKLRLPPAWHSVRVSEDPNAALQATGIDSKGRVQYRYSAEHSERQAAEKFARLQEFAKAVPQIEASSLRDMRAGSDAAGATYLIAQTGFRVGSDAETGAAVKAYGATTLLGKHVQVDGNKVSFNFTGKKGVEISKTIEDKPLADLIRSKNLDPEARLFKTTDADVRTYMKSVSKDDFKVKDFRTYHGTAIAMQHVNEEMKSPPTTVKERKAAERRVAERVAKHLGNTPTVARAAYIDPAVWGRLSVRK